MIKKAIKIAGNSEDIMFIKIISDNGGGWAIEDFLKLVSIPEPDAPDVGEIIIFRDIADDTIKTKDENGDIKVLVPKIPDFLTLKEITTPGKPEAGSIIVFLDESDKIIKTIDENEDIEPLVIDIDSLTQKEEIQGDEKVVIQNTDTSFQYIKTEQILPPIPAFKAVLLDRNGGAFFYSTKETNINKNSKNIIAADLLYLTALQNLYLVNNQLTTIVIPDTLTALQNLYLSYNQLTTIVIPDTLTALQNLYLVNNQLTQTAVDTLLAKIDASGATAGYMDISGGTNAIPTDGTSNANIISLVAKGWNVLYNV